MASEQQAVEPVYFFQRSDRTSKHLVLAPDWMTSLRATAVMLAVVLICTLLEVSNLGLASIICIGIVLLVVLAGRYLSLKWLEFRQICNLRSHPPKDGARLAVVGPPQWLERFGEPADMPFQPAFFSATFIRPLTPFMWIVAVFLATSVIGGAYYAINCAPDKSHVIWAIVGMLLAVWWCEIAVLGIVGWLWPTYFRIVPGRLDVLRFNNLLNRPVSVEHYNLRTAKLLIDLRRGVIFIDDADGRTGEFPIVWMRRRTRERLAYHLLLAALSSYQAPNLPDDKLLG